MPRRLGSSGSGYRVPPENLAAIFGPYLASADFEGIALGAIVACSGGPDSTALLALAVAAGLEPLAVHVDHGLRPGSDAEAEVVARTAQILGVKMRSVKIDVALGAGMEARARNARYAVLEEIALEIGAQDILVGHTADDRAETVLLHLLRGAAGRGLGGMPVRRGRIVRPIIEMRRSQTHELCAAAGFEVVDDPMNQDVSLRRVWVRNVLLPLLDRESGRDMVALLARQAAVLRCESDYLDDLARQCVVDLGGAVGDGASLGAGQSNASERNASERNAGERNAGELDAKMLSALPIALARRTVRCWLGEPPPSLREVDAALSVARGDCAGAQLTGRGSVRRRGGLLVIEHSPR